VNRTRTATTVPTPIAAGDVAGLLRPGMTVYAPGAAGESGLLADLLRVTPEAARGVRFVGVWLPGFNRLDYAGLHPEARATTFFVSSDLHDSLSAGRLTYLPVSYYQAYRWFADTARIDLAFLQVSPPDAGGGVSLGAAWDFTPAVLAKAGLRVAHVNPALAPTRGLTPLAWNDLDHVVEAEHAVAGGDLRDEPVFAAIGRLIAPLVPDGATVEVGIGGVQGVLDALAGHRNLAIHAGAITKAVERLAATGVIAARDGAITAGIAWGDAAFRRFCSDDARVRFAPVGWTHDLTRLAAIDRFVAINAALEVDLLGQANVEMIGGRQVSSAGGITDFMRGARLSPGGFSVVALPATARGGTVSRIVPALEPGTAVSVGRGDMELVATEHGVADLRGLDADGRAAALIAIAAPDFRPVLSDAWAARRARL